MKTELARQDDSLALALPPETAIEILREDGSPEAKKILHRVALQALRLAEAKMYSDAGLIPAHLRGKNAAIAVVCELADTREVDRFFALNNCYIVHDKVGFETKFYIGLLVNSGRIRGPLKYEFIEDKDPEKMGVTVSVVDSKSGETVSHTLLWKTIVKSGWAGKNTWSSDPRLMMKYRAAIQLIRTQYPDVMMGTYTKEELQEMEDDGAFLRESKSDTVDFPTGGTITERIAPKPKKQPPKKKKDDQPAPPLDEVSDPPFDYESLPDNWPEMFKQAKAELRNCLTEAQVQEVYNKYEKFAVADEDEAALAEACNKESERLSK